MILPETATPMPGDLFDLDSEARAKREQKTLDEGGEPCTHCGRRVVPGSAWVTVVVGGGSHCAHPDDPTIDESDDGHMGAWVLGSTCARSVDEKSRKVWEGWPD